jgi:acetoacetyl-[acyl-carrier protein] synthase
MGDEAVTLTGDAMQLNGGTTMPFDDDNGLAAYQINL